MSRISQDFIASVGYLYEEINIQQEDFLNEESQYYDAEATELVEDIISTVSSIMVCEGYSADGIIGFLADSSEETIIEKYLSFDESVLTESTVSEEYIEEQLELLENRLKAAASLGKAALKTLFGKGPGAGYAPVKLQGPRAPGLIDKGKALISKAVNKVKDIARGAKEALPKIAKGSLLGGAGVLTGYLGAKMGGAGEKTPEAAKPSPSSKYNAAAALGGKAAFSAGGGLAKMKQNPNMTAADVQKQGMINIRNKKPPVAAPKPAPTPSGNGGGGAGKPSAPASSKQTGDKEKDMAAWAKANPELAKKLKPDGTQKGTGQSKMERDAAELRDMQKASQMRQQGQDVTGANLTSVRKDIEKFNKPEELNKQAPAGTALAAEQERRRKKVEQDLKKAESSMKESYEPYEVLLEYLMGRGHADTIEEAHYIMLEMDSSAVRAVMEEYEDYLLAEEVSEWVDGLLDEGYDLSEYSWDDIVEYYVNEANRGDEHVTSSMYMSREPETKEAKVRRRQIRDGLPDNASHQGDDKDYDRQWAHKVSRGRKKLKPISHDTLAKVKDKNPSGKYAAMQRRKKQGLG